MPSTGAESFREAKVTAADSGQRAAGTRALVIQPLPGIGDMVWHLGHIRAIAAATPGGTVDLLAKPRSQADRLFAADPAVGRVLWLERKPGTHDGAAGLLRLARLLRGGRYAGVWILHGSWRYALAARLAGIPARVGFGSRAQRWFLSRPCLPRGARAGRHAIELATRLLALHGLALPEAEPRLAVLPEARERIAARFADRPKPWIALGIGSSEPFKQWGRDNFAELAVALGDPARRSLFILGGPGEAEMGRWIAGRTDGVVENAVGLPLEDGVALTAQCDLYLGNDTGLLNVAAALGVDALGLFGGSPPLAYSRRIHPLVPPDGAAGMAEISLEQVLAACARIVPDFETRSA